MNLQLGQEFMRIHRNEGEATRTVMEVKLKILFKPRAMNPVNCFNARRSTRPSNLLLIEFKDDDCEHR